MALTSQSARAGGTFGAYSTNRGRGRRRRRGGGGGRRLIGFVLAAGLLALLVWWAWPSGGAPSPAGPESALAVDDPQRETAQPETTARSPGPRTPQPETAADDRPRGLIAPLPEPRDSVAATRERDPAIDPARVLTMGASGGAAGEPKQPEQASTSRPASNETVNRPAQPASNIGGGPYTSPASVQDYLREAAALAERNRPLHARTLYNRALHDPRISERDRRLVRERMSALNQTLIFSPIVVDGDPVAEKYEIRPGDVLSRIARREAVNVDWRFLQRINGFSDPNKIRVGQTIKLVRGPFHAVVDKSDFRIDLYAGAPPMPPFTTDGYHGELPTYVTSFPVGLGEYGSTPTGRWVVRTSSKVENPAWTNPRTNESFGANDPENPIGEYWVGLEGVDENTSGESGYGIHGTIDPASIGQEMSMGCIRLGDENVALAFEMLTEGVSTVWIVD